MSPAGDRFYRTDADGLLLTVKVTPKAAKTRINGAAPGPDGPVLKVLVTAPPDKGKANAAVTVLLAEAFGVAKTHVTVVAGSTSRQKTLRVAGDPVSLAAIAGQWSFS